MKFPIISLESLTVIFRPPGEMTPTDDIVENKADNCPRNVVHSTRRWNSPCSAEDDREVDILDRGVRPLVADEVPSCGADCANEEEEYEAAE